MKDETYLVGYEKRLKAPGTWIWVEGETLSQRIYLQVSQSTDGRRFVSAIHIQNDEEVTGTDLRFPIARIAEAIVRALALEGPNPSDARTYRIDIREEWAGPVRALDAVGNGAEPRRARGRGVTPPSEGELREFAALFVREFAAKAHGAMTRATRAYGMDRTTGYRWLDRCRDLGLMPEEKNL